MDKEGDGNKDRDMVPDRESVNANDVYTGRKRRPKQTQQQVRIKRMNAYQSQPRPSKEPYVAHICSNRYHALEQIERSLFSGVHEINSGSETKGCFALRTSAVKKQSTPSCRGRTNGLLCRWDQCSSPRMWPASGRRESDLLKRRYWRLEAIITLNLRCGRREWLTMFIIWPKHVTFESSTARSGLVVVFCPV